MYSLLLIFITQVFAQHAPTLEEKLQRQWANYKAAQNLVLQNNQNLEVPVEKRVITRDQWEKILSPIDEYQITAQDLVELRKIQQQKIDEAKKQAIADSKIDLDSLRKLPHAQISSFCAQIPKGGMLHIHPGGTFNRQTVRELLEKNDPALTLKDMLQEMDQRKNVFLYDYERKWLRSLDPSPTYLSLSTTDQEHFQEFMFLPPGKHPFPRFNAVFWLLDFTAPGWDSYEKALMDFAQRAVREGVIYTEFSGGALPEMYLILQHIYDQTGLIIRIKASYGRTKTLEELDQQTKDLLALPENPWLVGIDFLDNEDGNPALEKGQLLYGSVLAAVQQNKSKLHRTMHAGEIGDVRNPRDAMILGAERLGHGVRLNEDPVALEYAARNHIAIEVNLSSNLRLTSITRISEHPFLNYLRLGLPISLSTDDEGIFDTDIQQECTLAIENTDVTYAELKQMAFNSIETSFASDNDKALLKAKLVSRFDSFEKSYSQKTNYLPPN